MRQCWLSVLLVLGMSVLGACGREADEQAGSQENIRPVLVATQEVNVTDLEIWLESVGVIHSVTAPTLAAEVAGRITAVNAYTGDAVVTGQLLATIDTTTLALQRRAAHANVERLDVHIRNAERRVARFEELSARNLSSQSQLDDANEQLQSFQAEHKAARAELALVDDSLAKARIVAPLSGVVQRRRVSPGDFVQRGQALFDIDQPQKLQAWLAYPETQSAKIRIGQAVRIESPLTHGEVYSGFISDLRSALGTGSRALMTITDIENPGELRPEATITGRVLIGTVQKAVVVPEASVVRRPDGDTVYVINGDRAQARVVTTGHHEGGNVEIIAGLQAGETIATQGAGFLSDDARVKLREPAP